MLGLGSAVLTWTAQREIGAVPSLASLPLSERFDNAALVYVGYLSKCFVPINLCVSYVQTGPHGLWQALVALGLLAGISLGAWHARQHSRWIPFGWFWFLITLLPNIGLLQAGPQTMADRYTYIPLIGVFLMLAGVFEAAKLWRQNSFLPTVLSFVTLAICSGLSVHQLGFWSSGVTLFQRAVDVDGKNWVARLGLGMALTQNGRFDEALIQLRCASALPGNAAEAERGLGVCYTYKGDATNARLHLTRALELNPRSAETRLLLTKLLAAPGHTNEESILDAGFASGELR